MTTNEIEIRVTSKDQSAPGMDSADRRVESLKAKLRDLARQKIQIDADTDQATQQIARLKRELKSGTRPKVEVEADITAATAKLDQLKAKAREITRARAAISVDVGEAQAQIRATKAALDEVDGKTAHAKIDVNVDSALRGIGYVIAGLGAAAAAGAAVGIGAVAGAGIGAAIAGLSGVGSAVKALGDAEKGAGVQAGQNAAHQLTLAGAVDRVRSAQAALKNTQASAADAERRSANQVRDAQQALTRARADAARQIRELAREQESLARQQEDMALEQRGALLDIAQAKEDLDKTLADPRATELQKQQARLAYDEAVQHNKDLELQAKQLNDRVKDNAAAKADADRKGVNGSEQVRDAQERLADAVAAAAETQRQSAFQVAQAQQAVVEAQRAVQQASLTAGAVGASAMDKIADSMRNLSPAGQDFARFMRGFIDGPIKQLRFATQEGLLPGLQAGLASLGPMIQKNLPAIKTFSTVFGQALGGIIEIAGKLATPFLKLATSALQGLAPLKGVFDTFASAFGKMVDRMIANGTLQRVMGAIVDLFAALLDLLPKILPSLVDLAAQALPAITDALVVLLPLLVKLAMALGPILVAALHAVAPLLGWLGDWVSKHSVLFQVLVVAILAIIGAIKTWTIVQGILNVVLAASPIGLVITLLLGLAAAFIWAWTHSQRFRDIVRGAVGVVVDIFRTLAHWISVAWDWLRKIIGIAGTVAHALGHIGTAWHIVTGLIGGAIQKLDEFMGKLNILIPIGTIVENSVQNALQNNAGGSGGGSLPRRSFASGGVAGGLVEVAERGGELIRLPQGSMVYPHGQSVGMLSASGQRVEVMLSLAPGIERGLAAALMETLRAEVRLAGGNVQATLGRA